MTNAYKIGSLHHCKLNLWQDPRQAVRIATRNKRHSNPMVIARYFVVALGDAPGHGSWVNHDALIPLTPLEQLAMTVKD